MQYFGFDRPSFALRTLGFGANFDPLTLFAGGKQGVWYDPSDKSTLFQDVAGTIPVTKDGDPVALMRDKSGNGNHATQSVSTARPVYKGLYYDGVDDSLDLSYGFPLADFTLCVAVDTALLDSEMVVLANNQGSGIGSIFLQASTGSVDFYRGTGNTLTTSSIRNTGVRVLTVTRKGDIHSLYIDGILKDSKTFAGAAGGGAIRLANWGGLRRFKGKIGSVVIVETGLAAADVAVLAIKLKGGMEVDNE